MIAITITLIIFSVAATAYFVGVYSERKAWNGLIRTGKIPRPSNPKLDHKNYWANH